MTTYNVHIDREVRLVFEGIDADSPEEAAAIACDKHPAAADDIDNCDGEAFSAQVDAAGEQHPTVTIDFEAERQRKAAAKLLDALKWITRCLKMRAPFGSTAYVIGDERMAQAKAAVAEAETAGIPSAPAGIDVHALLAERRQIAGIWHIEDVQSVRPDLTDDQAWQVLQAVRRNHDASLGINWDVLECNADILFGAAPARPDTAGTEDV
jgi:hypothetical protein